MGADPQCTLTTFKMRQVRQQQDALASREEPCSNLWGLVDATCATHTGLRSHIVVGGERERERESETDKQRERERERERERDREPERVIERERGREKARKRNKKRRNNAT